MKRILATLTLIALTIGGVVACRKPAPLPDEAADVYKKRLSLIYAGKAAVGAKTHSNATNVLVGASRLSSAKARVFYELNTKYATSVEIIATRIKDGFDKEVITAIDQAIKDVETFEEREVFRLQGEMQTNFYIITGGMKTTLATLKATRLGQKTPSVRSRAIAAKRSIDRQIEDPNNPKWVFDLVNTIILGYSEAEALTDLATVDEAYAAITAKCRETRDLNAQRIAALP